MSVKLDIYCRIEFVRLQNDPSVTDPFTASNSIVAQYADYYFEYNDDRRCVKESVQGGSQTFTYDYSESTNPDGPNSWKKKVVETRPDGVETIIFSNYAGLTMLSVLQDGSSNWLSFFKYDEANRVILQASPSAITGYDESKADLLDYDATTQTYTYLRDNAGLIRLSTIDSVSGKKSNESVQQGQLSTVIKLVDYSYIPCPEAGHGNFFVMSQETKYPSETDQTQTIVTSYSYTWYSGTSQIQQLTATLPAIPRHKTGLASQRQQKLILMKTVMPSGAWMSGGISPA